MRPPVMSDYQFIVECFADWPLSDKGPVTIDVAVGWLRRWMFRDDETCLIWDGVGLMTYRASPLGVVFVDNIVVHPMERGKGHSKRMMREIQESLRTKGFLGGEFDAIPGPVADKVGPVFERVSEGVGPRTGLPVIRGRVMADTDI